jgi:hypothetical protein
MCTEMRPNKNYFRCRHCLFHTISFWFRTRKHSVRLVHNLLKSCECASKYGTVYYEDQQTVKNPALSCLPLNYSIPPVTTLQQVCRTANNAVPFSCNLRNTLRTKPDSGTRNTLTGTNGLCLSHGVMVSANLTKLVGRAGNVSQYGAYRYVVPSI